MKKVISNLIIATVTGMIAVTTAHGQFSKIAVDEFGNGFYNGALLTSGTFPDPANGGNPGFAYVLPFNYTYSAAPSADILLLEPGPTPAPLSDLLRFTRDPSGGPNTLLFFYSDASAADPADAPADKFPMPNPVFVYTSGTEIGLYGNPYSEAGPNGFVYMTVGGPGWDGNTAGTEYTFISEVPEPNASLLASPGGGCLLWAFRSFRTLRRN